jgi:surfactin synthase thioesterase subunit
VYTTFRRPLTGDQRLICFPYAGGGANDYRGWAGRIPGVDVVAALLPGRDARFTERAMTTFEPLVDHLLAGLQPFVEQEFVLFGHSMGGLLAYELGRRLEAAGHRPAQVIVSGTASPRTQSVAPPKPLDDDSLVAGLRHDGVAAGELLANTELMHLLLPILRADLSVVADYRFDGDRPSLRAPLRLYYGEEEIPDPAALCREWAFAVEGEPVSRGFRGGHFFVRTDPDAVLRQLARDVARTEVIR